MEFGHYVSEPGKPYVVVVDLPEGQEMHGEKKLTSVVVDEDEFMKVVDRIQEKPLGRVPAAEWVEHTAYFRETKHIPLISRGVETEWIFEKFHSKTKLITIIVRGASERLIAGAV